MEQTLGSSSEQVLAQPVAGGRSLTTEERKSVDYASTIRGWGSDLEAKRRPGVPRDKAPGLGVESLYPPLPQQVPPFKIHKSTEHGRLTPVFGTSCPPTGLSGAIRDYAYQLSEGRLSHWMGLMLADRVNVVEALIGDLAQGHVPNIPREMGIRSELKYNGPAFARKAAITAVCAVALVALLRARRR